MNNLTQEQIGRVFGMYWGCGYAFQDLPHTYQVGMCNTYKLSWERGFVDCKLLLRLLSAIAEEHAAEVAYMAMSHPLIDEAIDRDEVHADVIRHEDGIEIAMSCRCWVGSLFIKHGRFKIADEGEKEEPIYYLPEIVQYLTQQGYAVPLFIAPGHADNGKTAIELGLGIALP